MRKYINTDNITLVSKQQIDIHVQLHLSARFISYAQKCPRTVWNDILKIYNEHPVLSHTCPWLDFQSVHFGSNGLKILWSNSPHSDAHIYRHSIDLRLPLPPSSHPKLNFLVIWWLYISLQNIRPRFVMISINQINVGNEQFHEKSLHCIQHTVRSATPLVK